MEQDLRGGILGTFVLFDLSDCLLFLQNLLDLVLHVLERVLEVILRVFGLGKFIAQICKCHPLYVLHLTLDKLETRQDLLFECLFVEFELVLHLLNAA